jgi:DNA topoisomerase-1
MYLVIVESPSKIKKIEEYLGSDYKCIASCGHICKIEKLKDIDENYRIKFSIISDKEKIIQKMKEIIKNYSYEDIYLATDDDNEGEGISYHICTIFNLPLNKTKRIIFHEITKTALLKSIKEPTIVNMNIVNSYFARTVIDILIGYKISPLLWKKFYYSKKSDEVLSAGRVQSPALKIIYDSEMQKSITIEKYKLFWK